MIQCPTPLSCPLRGWNYASWKKSSLRIREEQFEKKQCSSQVMQQQPLLLSNRRDPKHLFNRSQVQVQAGKHRNFMSSCLKMRNKKGLRVEFSATSLCSNPSMRERKERKTEWEKARLKWHISTVIPIMFNDYVSRKTKTCEGSHQQTPPRVWAGPPQHTTPHHYFWNKTYTWIANFKPP